MAMIIVSREMFEQMTRRAYTIARESVRRLEFNHEMTPEVLDPVRDDIVENVVEHILARWGLAASNARPARREAQTDHT